MGAKFSGGIALPHQAEHKEETANLPVQTLAPPQVVIPMAQGLARPALPVVEPGQTVKKGDPMLKLDLDYLKANAPSVASPVLCTELEDNQKIRLLNEGEIKAGDELFAIDIYEA